MSARCGCWQDLLPELDADEAVVNMAYTSPARQQLEEDDASEGPSLNTQLRHLEEAVADIRDGRREADRPTEEAAAPSFDNTHSREDASGDGVPFQPDIEAGLEPAPKEEILLDLPPELRIEIDTAFKAPHPTQTTLRGLPLLRLCRLAGHRGA